MPANQRHRSLDLAPASLGDYRELARRPLPRQIFDYIDGGAFAESTLAANRDGPAPRRASANGCCATSRTRSLCDDGARPELVDCRSSWRRSGFARHVRAPRRGAGGARRARRRACPSASRRCRSARSRRWPRPSSRPPWFQLYVMRDRGYAEDLMARAQAAGCTDADADRRPAGRGPPLPRRSQRHQRAGSHARLAWRARLGHRASPELGARRRPGRAAAHLRQPRDGPARGARARRLPGVGGQPVRPDRDLGRPRVDARTTGAGASRSRASSMPTTPARRSTAGSTPSSSPTTAGASSTTCPRPASRRCPRSSTRWATSARCWSTAGSAAASTWSRRWPWARGPAWSDGRGPTPWPRAASAGVAHVLRVMREEMMVTLGLTGRHGREGPRPLGARRALNQTTCPVAPRASTVTWRANRAEGHREPVATELALAP